MSESESDYSSSSSSSSESESDYENFQEILSGIGLRKKYSRLFAKAKIVTVDDARDLTDKRLRSIGVESSSDRKRIIKAIENATSSDDSDSSESDSDSEDERASAEMARLEKTLKLNGLKKYQRTLRKNGYTSLKDLSRLDDRRIKKLSVDSSEDRRKLLKIAKKTQSLGSSEVARHLSRDPTLKKYTALLVKDAKVKSLKDARRLSDRQLKKLGVKSSKHREKLIKTFAKGKGTGKKAKRQAVTSDSESDSGDNSSGSDSESDENEAIYKVLKTLGLQKHTKRFTSRDITSIRAGQGLGHNELRDIGFEMVGQREAIMDAFQQADWKCVYCHEWNEFRAACSNCTKTRRNVSQDSKFTMDQTVKYTGKFRPTTRIKSGDKGEIHRVLADEHYMVRIKKSDKTVKIRLRQNELVAC